MGTMKVTSREITLLGALLSVAVIYILYTFLFSPLFMNISVAREALNVAETQKNQIETNANAIPDMRKQQKAQAIEAEKKVEQFIPDMNEDIVVTFFAGTPANGGPGIDGISFDPLATVSLDTLAAQPYMGTSYPYGDWAAKVKGTYKDPGSISTTPTEGQPGSIVLAQGVSIDFGTATYEQAINQMKAVEALKRPIVVDSFSLSKGEGGGLSGTIHYSFYGVDKLTDKDLGLPVTVLTDPNGKANPFI